MSDPEKAKAMWKAGVQAARAIFDDRLEELTANYVGMFAGIQNATINIGASREELYNVIDTTQPYLIILIEACPPPTIDVFTRMEQRRRLMDRLTLFAESLNDEVLEEVILFAEDRYKEL